MVPPMPATTPERANTTTCCHVRLIPTPADAVSLPRMAPRNRPVVPRRTNCTPAMQTSRTIMAAMKKAWPLGCRMPSPTHWGLMSTVWPLLLFS